MQKKARKKDYAKAKKAFDAVIGHYRSLGAIGSIGALNMEKSGGGTPNPARPTPLDFRCDVEKVIKKVVPQQHYARFLKAYIFVECITDLEQEKWADKVLGGLRHSFEQRAGAEFVRKKLFPVMGRGYFWCLRRARGK